MKRIDKSTDLESEKQAFRVELRVAGKDETRFIALLQTNSDIDSVKKLASFKSPKSGGHSIDAVITPLSDEKGYENGVYLVRMQDITESSPVEESLRESEKKYRKFVETSQDLMWQADADRRFIYLNAALEDEMGYKIDEMLGHQITEFQRPEIAEQDVKEFWGHLARGSVKAYETSWISKSGDDIDLSINAVPLLDSAGSVIGAQGTAYSITAKQRSEKALGQSERDLRNLFTNAMEGIFRTTLDGKILFANPAMATILGYDSVEDILKVNDMDLYAVKAKRIEIFNFHKKYGLAKDSELELLKKDGRKIWVRISSTAAKDEFGEIKWYEGFIRDITKSKLFEQEVLQAQKLESVGHLAGGLAHDFNNTLMTIQLNVSTVLFEENIPPTLMKALRAIDKSVTKAKGITHQLLTFARGGTPVKKTTDIGRLIQESVQFALTGTNISPSFNIDDNLHYSNIDRGQISQVLSNLVINARHAMPMGGGIRIVAKNISVMPGSPLGPLNPGDYIRVSIRDHGDGIDPAILDSVFDPYFTTKEQGSGLGLFACFSIVDKHQGWITVESELGEGSEFIFYLPASDEALSEAITRDIASGTGRILIMDDEHDLRSALSVLLNRLGYTTSEAADGEEAIGLYSEAQAADVPFDLVILDLTIPDGLGGEETVKRLKKIDPNVKAIVSSGYSNESLMANYKSLGFSGVLPKPYKLDELAAEVRNVINQP